MTVPEKAVQILESEFGMCKGLLIRPFFLKGLIRPLIIKGLIRPFKGLIKPFKKGLTLIRPLHSLAVPARSLPQSRQCRQGGLPQSRQCRQGAL